MTVTRFCERLGIPRSSWYRWRAVGTDTKGPWPTPAQDQVETDAKTLAGDWDGWGHRKLAELKRVGIDDVAAGQVSDSTMFRVLRRNGLCLPANYTSEVRQLAGIRKEAFISPPTRRNRLWQADFSEYETSAGGVWNLGGVVDYWAKVNLACEVSIRKTTKDAIVFFEAIKYEHLYRREIGDGLALASEVDAYRTIYNTIRPHQAITMRRPLDRYQQAPKPNHPDPKTVSDS